MVYIIVPEIFKENRTHQRLRFESVYCTGRSHLEGSCKGKIAIMSTDVDRNVAIGKQRCEYCGG